MVQIHLRGRHAAVRTRTDDQKFVLPQLRITPFRLHQVQCQRFADPHIAAAVAVAVDKTGTHGGGNLDRLIAVNDGTDQCHKVRLRCGVNHWQQAHAAVMHENPHPVRRLPLGLAESRFLADIRQAQAARQRQALIFSSRADIDADREIQFHQHVAQSGHRTPAPRINTAGDPVRHKQLIPQRNLSGIRTNRRQVPGQSFQQTPGRFGRKSEVLQDSFPGDAHGVEGFSAVGG